MTTANKYDWNNPAPRDNEEEMLGTILADALENGYERVTKFQISGYNTILSKGDQDIDNDSLLRFLRKLENYCVTNIVEEEFRGRTFHYRRLEMVSDLIEKLGEDSAEEFRSIFSRGPE